MSNPSQTGQMVELSRNDGSWLLLVIGVVLETVLTGTAHRWGLVDGGGNRPGDECMVLWLADGVRVVSIGVLVGGPPQRPYRHPVDGPGVGAFSFLIRALARTDAGRHPWAADAGDVR